MKFRRLFRFRLRTLFVASTAVALLAYWLLHKPIKHAAAVDRVLEINVESYVGPGLGWPRGPIMYRHQLADSHGESTFRRWLRQNVGDKYFGEVVSARLRHSNLADKDMTHLVIFSHLSVLSLSTTHVSDDGLAYLHACHELEILALNYTDVSDAGIAYLAELPNLEKLGLVGTFVSDNCIDALCKIKSLRYVWFNYTDVTAEGYARLQAALPKCVIRPRRPTGSRQRQTMRDLNFRSVEQSYRTRQASQAAPSSSQSGVEVR